MKRLVLFNSIEQLQKEKTQLEYRYGFRFDSLNLNLKDSSGVWNSMHTLTQQVDCYHLFVEYTDRETAEVIMYSNGLACALLSLNYLYAATIPAVNLCDNWNPKDEHFINANLWREELNKQYHESRHYLESKNQNQLACPYTYLPNYMEIENNSFFSTPKYALLHYQKIAASLMERDEHGELCNPKDTFDAHILELDRRTTAWFATATGNRQNGTSSSQRKEKERLEAEYKAFYKMLLKCHERDIFERNLSQDVMYRFANELIYHSDAIFRMEYRLATLDNKNDDDRILDSLVRLVMDSKMPIVFHMGKLSFSKYVRSDTIPPIAPYCDFLKALTIILYEYAGENLARACEITAKFVDEQAALFADRQQEDHGIPDVPFKFPEERRGKHWCVQRAAAVCECYKYQDDGAYYNRYTFPNCHKILYEIVTRTSHPNQVKLELVKE